MWILEYCDFNIDVYEEFDTYEEAVAYCKEYDFDIDYIYQL